MKFKIIFLFVLCTAMLLNACIKNTPSSPQAGQDFTPYGNYAGNFQLIHLNPKNNKLDTSYASVTLSLNTDLTFVVGGDTTKIQAPSKGTFSADYSQKLIIFRDATVTKATPPNTAKKHLNGTFGYSYISPNLNITLATDTLLYNYSLVKN